MKCFSAAVEEHHLGTKKTCKHIVSVYKEQMILATHV